MKIVKIFGKIIGYLMMTIGFLVTGAVTYIIAELKVDDFKTF